MPMSRMAFALVTLAVAVPAVLIAPQTPLGQQVWPAPTHDATPTAAQLPFFMLMSLLEAIAFSGAVAFGLRGWKHTRRVAGAGPLDVAVHVSIAWMFGNFWIHDNLHYVNGMDLGGLLLIDYLFHVPLGLAGAVLAYAMVRLAQERGGGARPVETGLHAAQAGRPARPPGARTR